MLLTPRYDDTPILSVDGPIDDPSVPLLRQRHRLAAALADLGDEQWAAPSRCDGWSVQDVIAHLVGTNQFWALSITSGLAGEPTRFLAAFDPVATPPQMVDALRSWTPADALAAFVESNEALAAAVSDLDDEGWSTPAESPPGHVAIHAVVLHALWDSWIHERDVLLPLGLPLDTEADEVACCLMYAAALGPAFFAATGGGRVGELAVEAADPDVAYVVEVGETVRVRPGEASAGSPRLSGQAVDLVEALSFRRPLEHDLGPDDLWLVAGLGKVFDLA